ncbi:MAG: proprotein convertase P-domain-containing protein [Flavobacteriales bacterium]|nr:proprotein convertase P-domain-containing protein [Flavobacteriales bacterium]
MEDLSLCLPNTYLSDAEFPGITFAWSITTGIITLNSAVRRPTFTPTSPGTYNATLTVTTTLGTYVRTENGVVVVASAPVAACTPTSSNACNCAQTVNNVVFNTISNATDATNNVAYTDFSCTRSTVLAAGGTYPLSVSIRAGGSAAESLNGYIDWNNNGVFEDPSERVITGSTPANTSTTLNANVTVPGGAGTNTLLRMRLYGEAGTLSAAERTCGAAFFIGDVEDYGVYISSNVAGVSIAASPSSTITYGTNVTFTPTPVNGGASPVYSWFRNGAPVGTGATYQSNNLMPGTTIYCEMASSLAGVITSPALSNTVTMTVTGPPLSEFSGTPVIICSGGTVTYTDASLLSPTSWSWSFPGGTPSTSTAQNPVITYASAGTYNVTLTATNANGTGSVMTKTGYITVFAAPAVACTHTRTSAPGSGVGITNVTMNTINNNTPYDGAVMNNYTCSNATGLQINTNYPISVTGGTFNIQWLRVYIDYNNNGVFIDAGELVFSPANGLGTVSGNFTTPPAPTLSTLLRMRVISDFVNTAPGPCANVQYGQSEDYGVYFIPPGCTPPTATATATCANVSQYNVGVNLTNMGSATSIAIQVDNDAGGPNGFTTVQTVTGTGSYGPFGPFATGAAVNVRLVHNVNTLCNLNFTNVVGNCNGPGGLCANSSTTTTTIVDVGTVTNTITVPANGGQTITDLNVYVNLTHTYIEDVRITLQSPTGTTVALLNSGICGSNQNLSVEFNQQAATAIGVTCPPTNIFAIPSASLAAFNGQVLQGTWTLSVQDVAAPDVGTINSWCLIPTLSSPNVQVSPKVFLEGPYNAATGLMSDALRSASLVQNTQPYTGLGYAFTGAPGAGGTLGAGVLTVTGNNAIVDWMIVELRSTATPTTVVASCAALLQRDGDVVALDGTSPVSIAATAGSYHVAMRHRNHLGAMTLGGVALSAVPATVDFTSIATSSYGTSARKSISGAFPAEVLWAGDVTFDGNAQYTGNGNDRDPILVTVGSTTPNNVVSGTYSSRDVNMDGNVQYTGSGNDRDPILVNVGSTTPNNVRLQQLP